MAVTGRKTGKRIVYWVSFYFDGKQIWERSGTDERVAQRLERQRRREVKEGTYARERKPTMSVAAWLKEWSRKRTNRNADDDRKLVDRFLLTRSWLQSLRIEDVRPQHSLRLVEELKATPNTETGRPISEKYVSNIYGLWTTAMRDARIAELLGVDPCVLPRGMLRRKSRKGVRLPYEAGEIVQLLTRGPLEHRVFSALAFFTGGREGEIAGRRWSDWDRGAEPLSALAVTTQYNDRPLKTERGKGEHARIVPVHPLLAEILKEWWEHGFEFVHCRKPLPGDFILPRTPEGDPHTRSSAYKFWRAACVHADVANRSLHSTRHTFITLCRRGGARAEVVERITHNAAGSIVDQYTHWDWAPLCEAVLCLKLPLDQVLDETPKLPGENGGGAGNRSGGRGRLSPALPGRIDTDDGSVDPPHSPRKLRGAAKSCAGQGSDRWVGYLAWRARYAGGRQVSPTSEPRRSADARGWQ